MYDSKAGVTFFLSGTHGGQQQKEKARNSINMLQRTKFRSWNSMPVFNGTFSSPHRKQNVMLALAIGCFLFL